MSQRNRRHSSQSRRLIRKLAAHSTSLGVVVALHNAARANVIFTDLGPDGVTVRHGTFDIDLNADGLADFAITHSCSGSNTPATSTDCIVKMEGRNGGKALRFDNSIRFDASAEIDPLLAELPRVALVLFHDFSSTSSGDFACTSSGNSCPGGRRGFLGVAIPVDGIHAGWIDIYASGHSGFTVFGYAYETEPGAAILAGDTGISPNVPGDTNDDDLVDLDDLNNVRNNFGASGDGILGDTNGDDLVDLEDLNAVRNNFGTGSAVPEPPSLVLLAAGAAGLGAWRRKRGNHGQI